jgi:flagellar basal-body rod modification protein FlgD
MSVSGVNGNTAAGSTGSTNNLAFNDMSTSDFMKIITQELTQQDPFKPNDSNALLEQISNLRNVESQLSLQTTLQSLVSQNSFAAASQTIGKMVTGLDGDNATQTGKVVSVGLVDNKAVLNLDSGKSLDFSRVTKISGATAA